MNTLERFVRWLRPAAMDGRAAVGRALLLFGLMAVAGVHAAPPARVGGVVSAALPGAADRTMLRLPSGAMVAADIGHILQRGELVVAMLNADHPPFFSMDGATPVGIDVRMAQEIAAELKVNLRIDRSATSFDELVDIVARGDADLAASKLSRTLARVQSVRFSEPYLTLNHSLILNRVEFAKLALDKPLPTVLRNFRGSLGVVGGTSFAELARRHFPEARIASYPSWPAAIEAVKKGEVVGAYRDDFETRRVLKTNPALALTLRTVTLKDLDDPLGIAVGVRSPTLLAFVNQYLAQRPDKLTITSVLAELD